MNFTKDDAERAFEKGWAAGVDSVRDSRSAVPSELLKRLEELSKIVPMPPKAITYENGVEIVDFVQDIIMPEYYNWIKRGIVG